MSQSSSAELSSPTRSVGVAATRREASSLGRLGAGEPRQVGLGAQTLPEMEDSAGQGLPPLLRARPNEPALGAVVKRPNFGRYVEALGAPRSLAVHCPKGTALHAISTLPRRRLAVGQPANHGGIVDIPRPGMKAGTHLGRSLMAAGSSPLHHQRQLSLNGRRPLKLAAGLPELVEASKKPQIGPSMGTSAEDGPQAGLQAVPQEMPQVLASGIPRTSGAARSGKEALQARGVPLAGCTGQAHTPSPQGRAQHLSDGPLQRERVDVESNIWGCQGQRQASRRDKELAAASWAC